MSLFLHIATALGLALAAGIRPFLPALAWPGRIAGAAGALLAQLASRPVLEGASARLEDNAARYAVTLYADAVALILALLAWFVPPFSLLALAFFVSLLW